MCRPSSTSLMLWRRAFRAPRRSSLLAPDTWSTWKSRRISTAPCWSSCTPSHGIAGRGLIYGDDVLAALNSAKTTVLFFRTGGGHALVKVGLFDFAAAGALVVTNRFAEVEPYLAYGREIVGFDSTADLLRQVRYYLAHPAEAEEIRRAGRARVLAEHTWPAVWPRILARLGKREGVWPRLRERLGEAFR